MVVVAAVVAAVVVSLDGAGVVEADVGKVKVVVVSLDGAGVKMVVEVLDISGLKVVESSGVIVVVTVLQYVHWGNERRARGP